MLLKTITCSGVNEKNDVDEAVRFLQKYPNAEFGVQCSPKKAGYQMPRFEWLKELVAKLNEQQIENRVALHLNEGFVVSFCEGKVPDEISDLLNEGSAIGRLQLNFKIGRETFESKKIPDIKKLAKAMEDVKGHPIILSASEANLEFINKIHYQGLKFDALFDDSFGEGIMPAMRKAPLFEDVFQGYAGGLSPENVAEELVKIGKVAKKGVFIDAEGKLKEDGLFSFKRAEMFVQNALNWNRIFVRQKEIV